MKNADLSIIFSVQGTGGNLTGPDLENRVGDQDIGSPGGPVSSGLQVPSELGFYPARTRHPWWASCGVFPSKCPSFAPLELSNTPCWLFSPLEDNQWGGCCLDPKKSRRELFQQIFALGIFWGGVSHCTSTPLIVALSLGHSDITRVRPSSPVVKKIIWIASKKILKLLRQLAPLMFLICVQAFRDPLCGELPHSFISHSIDLIQMWK